MVQFHATTTAGTLMKPLDQWTQADLQALIGTPESLTVDFKQSEAILIHGPNKEKVRASLVKDITALANAAGGRVYYGLREDKTTNVATELDDGVTLDDAKADVIADIITGNTEPQIVGLSVHEVRLDNGRYAFVINVPQATTLAPHQSRYDHVYYRRHDRKILKMYDHEIKDVMRRNELPLIQAKMQLLLRDNEKGNQYVIMVDNASLAIVKYFSCNITLESPLALIQPPHHWVSRGVSVFEDTKYGGWSGETFMANFTPNAHMPLFKGQSYNLLTINSPPDVAGYRKLHFQINAPGFQGEWRGFIRVHHHSQVIEFEPINLG